MRLLVLCLLSLALLFIAASPLTAQTTSATLTGTITDRSSSALPNAAIKLEEKETGLVYRAKTDAAGRYTILELPPGSYALTVELVGFRKLVQTGLVLEVEQVARLDLTMEVGTLAQVLEVIAAAPLLNTEVSSKGEVISNREITEMPLNGRDFNELAYLAPGVAPKAQGGQGSFASINGARADNTNFIVDGMNNQNPRGASAQVRPPLEAIQEFRVDTSTFTAEYGRLAGGVLNMALRSGTNRFRGSLFEYFRNDVLDARSFFDPAAPMLRRNQFGAALGGPVIVPRLFDGRQSTFFYAAWESYRQRLGQTRLGRIPTVLERQGDFSQNFDAKGKLFTVFDPLTKTAFPRNIIPRDRFSTVSARALQYYPLPNRDGANNLLASSVDPDDWDSFSLRADRRIAGRHSLSFRALLRDNRTASPFNGSDLGIFGMREAQRQHLYAVNYAHMFGPTHLLEVRGGLTRTRTLSNAVQAGHDFNQELGVPSPGDPRLFGFPRFTIRGMINLGNAADKPVDYTVNNFQFAATQTKVAGAKTIKAGADILRTQFFQPYFNNNRGTFNFNGRWTADRAGAEGPADTTGARSGSPVADFLLGFSNQTTRQVGWVDSYMFTTSYSFFVLTDWKALPNLTLNLGLRYELPKPPVEKYNKLTNFLPALGRVVIAGESGFPRSLVELDVNNLAPRAGFAWRPRGLNHTVVRGGYGIFYGAVMQNPVRTQLSAVYPFAASQSFSANFSKPGSLTLSDPFPQSITAQMITNQPNGFQFDAPTSYVQQYNLTIQRQVGAASALEAGYIGSKGTHLGRHFNWNQPFRRAEWAPNFPFPFPQFSTIDYLDFNANSNYNALAIGWRKASGRGLTYRVSYTYSKSIDDASQLSSNSDGGYNGAQDVRNLRLERGLSDFDRRHTLVSNYLFDLPIGRGKRLLSRAAGWRELVASGWQAGGLARFHTGQPFTVRVSNSNLDLGEANRPDRLGPGTAARRTVERWFKVEDFATVPAGAFRPGNSGRNILSGPSLLNFDFGLYKRVTLPGERILQIRVESFNLLNHPNFHLPVNNIDTLTSGTIQEADGGRLIQIALRFLF